MSATLIFGHKNPDTDSICSALAYADLKAKTGADVEAVRLGAVSAETQFALDYFKLSAPRLVESVAAEASHVILLDHNERQQSATDIDKVTIAEVIDHHRIANFETAGPLYYRAEPVGCTATIVQKMYKEKGIAVSPPIAGLMLSAILSDTLILKSPTCTPEDVAAAEELAGVAGVDLQSYGLEMLKAGASLSDKTVAQLISMDSKEFTMGASKVEIAQVNAVDSTKCSLTRTSWRPPCTTSSPPRASICSCSWSPIFSTAIPSASHSAHRHPRSNPPTASPWRTTGQCSRASCRARHRSCRC
jgi:manganese-dependent inorganic pyrophosphatase